MVLKAPIATKAAGKASTMCWSAPPCAMLSTRSISTMPPSFLKKIKSTAASSPSGPIMATAISVASATICPSSSAFASNSNYNIGFSLIEKRPFSDSKTMFLSQQNGLSLIEDIARTSRAYRSWPSRLSLLPLER